MFKIKHAPPAPETCRRTHVNYVFEHNFKLYARDISVLFPSFCQTFRRFSLFCLCFFVSLWPKPYIIIYY